MLVDIQLLPAGEGHQTGQGCHNLARVLKAGEYMNKKLLTCLTRVACVIEMLKGD